MSARMRIRSVSLWLAACTVVGAAGAFLVFGTRVARPRSSTTSVVLAAAPEPNARGVRAEGRVVTYPGATVDVGSEAGGRVKAVLVKERDQVRAGHVIVELASSEERAALDEARARRAEAESQVKLLEARHGRTATLAEQGHASAADLDDVTYNLAAARARTNAVAAEVERLEAALAKRSIRAPIGGVVITRYVEPGEVIPPATRLVTIADLDRMRVEAQVDEYDIDRMKVGEPVIITAEGYEGREWVGSVESIPDAVVPRQLRPEDPARPSDTRVLLVKIALPRGAPFKLGQRVELRIGGEPEGAEGAT
ncbi:MAG TPA: efflux RND transporter periplasmic adaptor subunit [Gemmatimonadaceae bacterium]|jgi:RND family efflux transporter, MFP subunit